MVIDQGRLWPVASWFGSPVIGAAMQRVMERPFEEGGAGFTEAALSDGQTAFLPRVADWKGADAFRRLLLRAGEASARELWDAYAGAAVIACPARDPGGRVIGALEAVCFDADRPFASEHLQTVELMADMAALAYERSVRSRLEAAQARVEGQLEQARGDVSGSLETGEVASRAP